jgi:pimeloyl-ACP methyl ester carboxylesterase
MKTQRTHVMGLNIAFWDTAGSAPILLLFHGNSSSKNSYEKQFSGNLPKRFRLIAPDFPGHGESAPASSAGKSYSPAFFSDFIREFSQSMGAKSAIFVGHSLGGHFLLETAEKIPDAQGFCIFGTGPISTAADFPKAFLPSPAAAGFFKPDLSDAEVALWASEIFAKGYPLPPNVIPNIRKTDSRMRGEIGQALISGQIVDEVRALKELKRPVAILHGEREAMINGSYLQALSAPTLWRGQVQRIPAAGHSPHWETSDEFDALLSSFAEDVAKSP